MNKWLMVAVGAVLVGAVGIGVFLLSGSNGAAATVNGVPIPQAEVEKQISLIKQQQGNLFEGPEGKEKEASFRQSILDYLIEAELIKQESENLGITVSDKEIDAKLDQVREIFSEEERFQQALKEQGLTLAELRDNMRDQTLVEKVIEHVTKDVKVSEKDIRDYFKANKADFADPEQKHWRQVVVEDKSKADELLGKLKDGADFTELAKSESIDELSREQGGDLGWVPVGAFPPDIEKELSGLGSNDLSSVIKGQNGYQIFQLLEVKAARDYSFDEVKEQIEQTVMAERQRETFSAWMDKLKSKATIKQ
jgi:foldase protein PrsA